MVYRLLGLVTIIAVVLFAITLIANVNPLLATVVSGTIALFIIVFVLLGLLLGILEIHDRATQWEFYGRYILQAFSNVQSCLADRIIPFIHSGLIVLSPPFVLFVLTLPPIFSILAAGHIVVASYRHSQEFSTSELSGLLGALAIIVAILAFSFTILPTYIGLTRRMLTSLRVTQSKYLKGDFNFSGEMLSHQEATDRLFAEDPVVASPNSAREILDKLKAGILDAYKYTDAGRTIVVEFSPPELDGLPVKVCYIAYSAAYRPQYLAKLPRRKRSWQHILASLSWFVAIVILFVYGFTLYIVALVGMNSVITRFVDIFFIS